MRVNAERLSMKGFMREKNEVFVLLKMNGFVVFLKRNHEARQSRSDSATTLLCFLTKTLRFNLNNTVLLIQVHLYIGCTLYIYYAHVINLESLDNESSGH